MSTAPYARIVGLETEFGCCVLDESLGRPESIVRLVKDHVFYEMKLGVLDHHARDEVFEPARSGGFLMNGARLYIDAVGDHLEYATAECSTLDEVVANDRAGHRIITRAVRELGLKDRVKFFNNSVDHYGGHTFGCHENYLVHMEDDFFTRRSNFLTPFLVTRQIFAGVGRVGGHLLTAYGNRPTEQEMMRNPIDYIWVSEVYGVAADESVDFQLSQRADHILKTTASRVRFNRALINPKWEHFYSHDVMQRLHLLFGEANQLEYAFKLKLGTTRLALRLAEDDLLEADLLIASPLRALRSISRDSSFRWEIETLEGAPTTAIDVQRRYLELAKRYAGTDPDTDWTLVEWERTLDALATDPVILSDRLDWVAKYALLQEVRNEDGLDWNSPELHNYDLEYHNIDPDNSLAQAWIEMGRAKRSIDELDVIDAMTDPPKTTRAHARGQLVRQLLKKAPLGGYVVDWSGVQMGRLQYVDLSDPFNPNLPEADDSM